MDQNYNETPPLLTSSDFECIMEDLKPNSLMDLGSPFRIEQNISYEDSMTNSVMRPSVQLPLHPAPPPLEEYGLVPVNVPEEPKHEILTTPPKLSPSHSPTGTIPSREDYPGYLDFEIQLDSATSSKKSWLFSIALRKVFIDVNKALLVQFRVNNFMNGLFVRALPVYEQDDYVSVPVQRCGLHAIVDDPHFKAHPASEPGACYCVRHKLVGHVVVCNNPQAMYEFNSESERHSVVVPLQAPHTGSDTTTVEYQFTCKTSCPHGMNRKPIVVIFTLENEQCEVLGRIVLPVKICSCPKRDKEKEEKEKEEREKDQPDTVPKQGKRRLSTNREKIEAKKIKKDDKKNDDPNEDQAQVLEVIVSKIENLETTLSEHLHNLEYRTNVRFNQLDSKTKLVDQKLSDLKKNEKLKQLEEKMTILNEKIDQLMAQQEAIIGFLTSLKF